MKRIKITLIILLCLLTLGLVACAKKGYSDGGGGFSYSESEAYYKSDAVTKDVGDTDEDGSSDKSDQGRVLLPGQLTACAYSDNERWDYFQSLITKGQQEGAFFTYQEKYKLASNRIKLNVKDKVVAKFSLLDDNDQVEFTTFSDNFGNVYLFNNETGKLVHTFSNHSMAVRAVCFSPDSRYVVSGSDDKKINVYEVEHGNIVSTLYGHTSWILSLDFSPDGIHLASGSSDKRIKIWDISSKECIHTFDTHTEQVWGVAYNKDGSKVVSVSDDKSIAIHTTSDN